MGNQRLMCIAFALSSLLGCSSNNEGDVVETDSEELSKQSTSADDPFDPAYCTEAPITLEQGIAKIRARDPVRARALLLDFKVKVRERVDGGPWHDETSQTFRGTHTGSLDLRGGRADDEAPITSIDAQLVTGGCTTGRERTFTSFVGAVCSNVTSETSCDRFMNGNCLGTGGFFRGGKKVYFSGIIGNSCTRLVARSSYWDGWHAWEYEAVIAGRY